jgi:uncharacterized protein YkwD
VPTPFLSGVLAFVLTFAPSLGAQRQGSGHVSVADVERRVHDLINRERAKKALTTLEFDDRLATIARAHSQEMARRNFFSHVNPDGLAPSDRVKRAGYDCRSLGENLFQTNLYSRVRISGGERFYDWNTPKEMAAQSVRGWMNSPGHRENILRPGYRRTGIGVAIAADDKVYVTQLFC